MSPLNSLVPPSAFSSPYQIGLLAASQRYAGTSESSSTDIDMFRCKEKRQACMLIFGILGGLVGLAVAEQTADWIFGSERGLFDLEGIITIPLTTVMGAVLGVYVGHIVGPSCSEPSQDTE